MSLTSSYYFIGNGQIKTLPATWTSNNLSPFGTDAVYKNFALFTAPTTLTCPSIYGVDKTTLVTKLLVDGSQTYDYHGIYASNGGTFCISGDVMYYLGHSDIRSYTDIFGNYQNEKVLFGLGLGSGIISRTELSMQFFTYSMTCSEDGLIYVLGYEFGMPTDSWYLMAIDPTTGSVTPITFGPNLAT